MKRSRRVRIRYPQSVVDLTIVLSRAFDRRKVAASLGLPRSSVYRWTSGPLRPDSETVESRQLAELVDACESDGIAVRDGLLRLLPESHPEREGVARCVHVDMRELVDAPSQCFPVGELLAGDDALARARRAKSIIDSRFHETLSCDGLAHLVGMGKFGFIRAFTLAFAVSPYRYLLSVRVQHAKRLLPRADRPLHDIAASVGFGSTSSMQRAFRKLTGRSPANFSSSALRTNAVAANAADWSVRAAAT